MPKSWRTTLLTLIIETEAKEVMHRQRTATEWAGRKPNGKCRIAVRRAGARLRRLHRQ